MKTSPESDRERDILYRVIQIASSSLDPRLVLGSVVDLVSEAVGCETCFVYLMDRDRQVLVLRAAPKRYEACVDRVELRLGEGVAGWAAERRESVLLHKDAMDDPRYRYVPELEGERFQAMLSVPIISRGGALIGVINVHAPLAGHFTEQDRRFLDHAASLVAGGIENAQLFQIAERKDEARAALIRKTIHAQEEERRRVATEIHDGVTQQLVSIWYRVQTCHRLLEHGTVARAMEELRTVKELIDQTLDEARAAIYDLRPATLDDLGLIPALHELTGRFRSDSGLPASLEADDRVPLTPHIETALYRIAQEALANVRKHASAAGVRLRLRSDGCNAELVVSDDGKGFSPDRFFAARSHTSFGLAGMRERVELVGGSLSIDSRPGAGTTLRALVPLREQRAQVTA